MSRSPWSPIQREAHRWRNESVEQANRRTLDKIEAAEGHRNLLRDVTNLAIIESRYPDEVQIDLESEAARIPCPICKSKKYLVPSFGHPKILVCDRPNCTYERTRQKTYEITMAKEPKLKVVK